ncbi:MAG TPA: FtsL-like putative cell division protein [Bacteroidia bacterium]|nr:FtsL-like putative cell division protein [Bacteroidia bacterium]HNU32334.1 FtsL-like putative cell division protein [Bacteroidia bacterium]
MENSFKKPPREKAKQQKQVAAGSRFKAARRWLKVVNIFGLVDKGMLLKVMPFIFFLTVLGLFYIANSYTSERTIRNIDKTAKEIKELRSEYISVKSDLMFVCRQSQVAKSVEPYGIRHLTTPPKKIVLKSQQTTDK